ncbi:hypothetical protein MMC10_005367 [Thelotrema lepadinum]|nr:hypothetical protein [Thelotrema lepadinum]
MADSSPRLYNDAYLAYPYHLTPLVSVPNDPSFSDSPILPSDTFPSPNVGGGSFFYDGPALERQWKERFRWIVENEIDAEGENDGGETRTQTRFSGRWKSPAVFPLVLHPAVSGAAHAAGTIDRFLGWLKGGGDFGDQVEVEFVTCAQAVSRFEPTDIERIQTAVSTKEKLAAWI